MVDDGTVTFTTPEGRAKLAAVVDQFQEKRPPRGDWKRRLLQRFPRPGDHRQGRKPALAAAASFQSTVSQLAVKVDYNIFESAFLVASVRNGCVWPWCFFAANSRL